MHKIVIISAGPGGSDHITDHARMMARACDVLIGSAEQLAAAGRSEGQTVYDEWGIEKIINLLERHEGQMVGVLVTGDAGIYSLSGRIMNRFGRDSVVEVIPGVSSLQAAFAKIRESWLDVRIFSYREEPFEGFEEVLQCDKVAIFCDKDHDSRTVLRELEKAGLFSKRRKVYVCQELTLGGESIVEIIAPGDIENLEVKRREIVIVIDQS
jgi:cobalt-precorrin-7 (C5)-methyltransferase